MEEVTYIFMTIVIGILPTNLRRIITPNMSSTKDTRSSSMTVLALEPHNGNDLAQSLLSRRSADRVFFRVSGFNIQLNTQTPILVSLAQSLKQGRYSLPNYLKPKKIILLGHSFGSFVSHAALALNPTIADAAILTGYNVIGLNPGNVVLGVVPRVASIQDPANFSSYDVGYLTDVDVYASINSFFKAPEYAHDVAQYLESTKLPFAVAEVASVSSAQLDINASAFKGPALVISGEYDHIVCGGYCPGELQPSFAGKFGGALETYVQPLAGHSLNFHLNTTGFFGVIDSFLSGHGL